MKMGVVLRKRRWIGGKGGYEVDSALIERLNFRSPGPDRSKRDVLPFLQAERQWRFRD
jgi:hypothetical protein